MDADSKTFKARHAVFAALRAPRLASWIVLDVSAKWTILRCTEMRNLRSNVGYDPSLQRRKSCSVVTLS